MIRLSFACQLISKGSCEGAELGVALVFLGPDTGFCLIFTSTLEEDLFLPTFDEAQDKPIQIVSSKTEF